MSKMMNVILAGTMFATFSVSVPVVSFAASGAPVTINLCTGKPNGGYDMVGKIIAENAVVQGLNVNVITGTGGSWGNVTRSLFVQNTTENIASGASCDAFIAQRDAIMRLQRQARAKLLDLVSEGPAVTEAVHFICTKDSKIGKLSDLGTNKIAVGGPDSGSRLVWENATTANPELSNAKVVSEDPISAVTTGSAQCGLIVGVVGDPDVVSANDNFSDKLKMSDFRDGYLGNVVDPITNSNIYRSSQVPINAYPKLLKHNWSYGDTFLEDSYVFGVKSRLTPDVQAKLRNAVNNSRAEIESMLVPVWARNK